tara:strand:+ start:910 stop:1776 length:867 start_codon:yes stop_codon:yes gene_type:complete
MKFSLAASKKAILRNRFVVWILTFRRKRYYQPHRFIRWVIYLPKFYSDKKKFLASAREQSTTVKIKDDFPVVYGIGRYLPNRHYWFQDIWAAREIAKIAANVKSDPATPLNVLDIGSRVEGYIMALLSNNSIQVTFGDINIPEFMSLIEDSYKPLHLKVDLQDLAPGSLKNYQVISSLHVIEHLGLAKYGDKIDVNGHTRIFSDMYEAAGLGSYFVVSFPYSDQPGIWFNAGRDCDPKEMIAAAKDSRWRVESLAFVNDGWELIDFDPASNDFFPSARYGCMMMVLKK